MRPRSKRDLRNIFEAAILPSLPDNRRDAESNTERRCNARLCLWEGFALGISVGRDKREKIHASTHHDFEDLRDGLEEFIER